MKGNDAHLEAADGGGGFGGEARGTERGDEVGFRRSLLGESVHNVSAFYSFPSQTGLGVFVQRVLRTGEAGGRGGG